MPGRPVPPRHATAPAGEVLLTADRLGLPPRLAPTDLAVRAGEALAVLGPNGAGKSTLALLLGGLLRPGTGAVTATAALAGRDARHCPAPLAGTRPGPADRLGLPGPGAPVRHRHRLRRAGARPAPHRPARGGRQGHRGRRCWSGCGWRRLAGANPYTLSGGEARRLSVATALATAPRLLICDEPTFGQDRRTWRELVDLFAELRDAGHGVVTVTHDPDFVAALADRHRISPAPRSRTARHVIRHRAGRRARTRRWPGATRWRSSPPRWSSRSSLIATLDPVAPAIAIAVELAVLPLFGIRYRVLARRAWPLLVSAVGILVTLVLFAADRSGRVLVDAGPVLVTTGVLITALGLVLRLLAVALPGVIVFATTDPTDLADALIQNAKAPARFAIGALAAFRLVPLLGQEWQMISMARRARGVDAGRNPLAKLRLFVSTAFALLVGAIRRGTRLAVAMDARGFDAGIPRTVARRQRFTAADGLLVAGAAVLAGAALTVSVLLGTFRPLIG